MNKVFRQLSLVTAVSAAIVSAHVSAYEAGDIIVRAGLATVAPDESSDGVAIPAIGVGPIAGTEAEVDDDTQLGLTLTYMLSGSLGIELLAATPFSHDITANLSSAGFGKVDAAETKQLPPTVSVVWYPMAANDSAFQPYVGAGLNYTVFFEEDVDADLEAGAPVVVNALTAPAPALAGVTNVPMDLDLDDSFGLALQVGVDYALNKKWHLNASVRWIDIDTDATFTSSLGDTITVDDVEIDPWVYQLNVGYKF